VFRNKSSGNVTIRNSTTKKKKQRTRNDKRTQTQRTNCTKISHLELGVAGRTRFGGLGDTLQRQYRIAHVLRSLEQTCVLCHVCCVVVVTVVVVVAKR
jgi:hypothetical protein